MSGDEGGISKPVPISILEVNRTTWQARYGTPLRQTPCFSRRVVIPFAFKGGNHLNCPLAGRGRFSLPSAKVVAVAGPVPTDYADCGPQTAPGTALVLITTRVKVAVGMIPVGRRPDG